MGTLKYINLLLHIDIHLQRVKYIINEQSMNINVFLLFFSFVFLQIEREREREGVYKIGYKEKQSQGYLSYLDGFLWRIFPLLRANRLYAIFTSGLKKMAPSCPRYFFVFFYPEYLALVLPATNPVQWLTFLLFISADGKKVPLPF